MCSAPIPSSEFTPSDITPSEFTPSEFTRSDITPEHVYLSRRKFLGRGGALAVGGVGALGPLGSTSAHGLAEDWLTTKGFRAGTPIEGEDTTPVEYATSYNNFYEFGTDKSDPARHAHEMTVDPWERGGYRGSS